MKVLVLVAGLAVFFILTGCEEAHAPYPHPSPGYGSSYNGPAYPAGYSHGTYRGYPNYPNYDYRP